MSGSSGCTVDHVIIFVPELESAHLAMGALGFAGMPSGRHSHFGTVNRTYMLAGTYIELLASEIDRPAQDPYRRHFDHGGGLRGLALSTDNAEATARALDRAGIRNRGPVHFCRDTPDGVAQFRTVSILQQTQFDAYVFFCEQLTPELVWRNPPMAHPNGGHHLIAATLPAADGQPLPREMVGTTVFRCSGRHRAAALVIGVKRLPGVVELAAAGFVEVRQEAGARGRRIAARHPALGDVDMSLVQEM